MFWKKQENISNVQRGSISVQNYSLQASFLLNLFRLASFINFLL